MDTKESEADRSPLSATDGGEPSPVSAAPTVQGFRLGRPSGRRVGRTASYRVVVFSACVGLVVGVGLTLLTQLWVRQKTGTGNTGRRIRGAGAPALPAPGGLPNRALILGMAYYVPNPVVKRELVDLAAYLQKRLKRPVKVADVHFTRVGAYLNTGRLDMAMFTPNLYVLARSKYPNLVLLGTQLADGALTYEGYIVVTENSWVRSLSELEDKRLCFVSRRSTSGYLFPVALLKRKGLNPERNPARLHFSGSHQRAVEDLVDGRCDAAAISAGAYLQAMLRGAHLRIVAVTERIPGSAYCASPSLPGRTIKRLRQALITFDPERDLNRKFIGPAHRVTGFVAVGDQHYDPVRRVHALVGLGRRLRSARPSGK